MTEQKQHDDGGNDYEVYVYFKLFPPHGSTLTNSYTCSMTISMPFVPSQGISLRVKHYAGRILGASVGR